MKKILFLLLFITTLIYAQKDPNTYDFFGGKSYNKETVFFRLIFQINNGKVNGYMYTDEQGNMETKAIIKGTFNYKTKRIFFNETRKLLTRDLSSINNPTFLQASMTLSLNPQISKLNGVFTEENRDKTKKINGTIKLISPDAFIKLKELIKNEKEIAKNNIKEKVIKKEPGIITILPAFDSDKKTTIKDDEEIIIYWSSNKLILNVWDDMKEDGDEISIKLNDEILLDNFVLKNKKEIIEIDLTEQENKLEITANSTGFIANNTARIDLFDNKIKHQIITELQLNKSVNVIIKKQN